MKIKYPINLHKGLTTPVVLAMMFAYGNFGIAPWVYLALHGTYGLMWLVKDAVFPDQQWENEMPLGAGISTFFLLGTYWIAPFLLISSGSEPSVAVIALAITTNIFGVLLHFGSDAQKHFMLLTRTTQAY
jgi:hypothetical protein